MSRLIRLWGAAATLAFALGVVNAQAGPHATTLAVTMTNDPVSNAIKVYDAATGRLWFDADGSGVKKQWTWVTKDAGWLVFDHKKTGKVDSALQLFGGVTFWMFWDNGYDALRSLDDNGDGVLTAAELDGLAVWCDANGNGVCDPGEVRTLGELGIVALAFMPETKGQPLPEDVPT